MNKDDIQRLIRESGMTFHLGKHHETVIRQLLRFASLVEMEVRNNNSKDHVTQGIDTVTN